MRGGADAAAGAAVADVALKVEALVDAAIAVLIGAVAGLDAAGLQPALTAVGGIAVEVREARGAVAHGALAVPAHRDGVLGCADVAAGAAVAGVALQVEALVDAAIAVLVDAVAGLDPAVAHAALAAVGGVPVAVDEALRAARQDAGAALTRGDALVEGADVVAAAAVRWVALKVETLVGAAVAVLVLAVAGLVAARRAGILAAIPGVAVQVDEARVAGRHRAQPRAADALGAGGRAGSAAGAAVSEIGVEIEALVGGVIAVVVQPVADLDAAVRGHAPRLAAVLGPAVDVLEVAQAGPDRAGAVHARGRRVGQAAGVVAGAAVVDVRGEIGILVGVAVAVVVDGVAGLAAAQRGHAGVLAAIRGVTVLVGQAGEAGAQRAGAVDAEGGGAWEGAGVIAGTAACGIGGEVEVLVHPPIAVVVAPVALLGRGHAAHLAAVVGIAVQIEAAVLTGHPRAAAVGAGGDRAGPLAAHVAGAAVGRIGVEIHVLVDLPVAVVVAPIAAKVVGGDARAGVLAAVLGRAVEVEEAVPTGAHRADARDAVTAGVGGPARRVARSAVVWIGGEVDALVDGTVAVVVEAVADLGRVVRLASRRLAAVVGPAVLVREARRAVGDLACAHDTGADGVGRRARRVAGAAVGGVALEVEALVGGAIAVVVDGVAGLDAAAGEEAGVLAAVREVAVQITKAFAAGTGRAGAADAGGIGTGQGRARVIAGAAVGEVSGQIGSAAGRLARDADEGDVGLGVGDLPAEPVRRAVGVVAASTAADARFARAGHAEAAPAVGRGGASLTEVIRRGRRGVQRRRPRVRAARIDWGRRVQIDALVGRRALTARAQGDREGEDEPRRATPRPRRRPRMGPRNQRWMPRSMQRSAQGSPPRWRQGTRSAPLADTPPRGPASGRRVAPTWRWHAPCCRRRTQPMAGRNRWRAAQPTNGRPEPPPQRSPPCFRTAKVSASPRSPSRPARTATGTASPAATSSPARP